ncbi:hypothetical protein HK096_009647, partial [Nowakowskiella sp. JEL0078]
KNENCRDEISILKLPKVNDLITALNYFVKSSEKKTLQLERERKERLLKEAQKVEKIRKEMEKRALAETFLKNKEAEMLAKKSIRAARQDRMNKREKKSLPRIDKFPKIISQASEGITHQSCCHSSREVMNFTFENFPIIPRNWLSPLTSEQVSKNKRQMPVEKIHPQPFSESTTYIENSKQRYMNSDLVSYDIGPSFHVTPHSEFELYDTLTDLMKYELQSIATQSEIAYIRSEIQEAETSIGGGPDARFRTSKKYFIIGE